MGVDVFFVISGFVITSMLVREWQQHGRIRLRRFYWRRFKRLTPALAVTVSVTMLVALVVLSPLGTQQATAATGLGALALAANVVISRTTGGYFDAPAETNALLNTWSLSVEEQFYLVFPLVLVMCWTVARRTGLRHLAVVTVAVGAAISFALAVVGSGAVQMNLPPRLVYLSSLALGFYSPVTRAWEFAAGALLALGGALWLARRGPSTRWIGLAGMTCLLASLWLIDGSRPFPGFWTLLPVAGTMLVISAGEVGHSPVGRLLSTPAMVWFGDLSYSLYLWHWPAIVAARSFWPGNSHAALYAAIVSFAPAIASYYFVEQPLRSRPVVGRARITRLVAMTLTPPVLLGSALLYASEQGFWQQPVRDYRSAIGPDHAGQRAGCSSSLPWEHVDACTWNKEAQGRHVYLVGDSHAEAFSEAVIGAGKALDRPVINLAVNGCAYSRVQTSQSVCGRVFSGVDDYLTTASPGVVVIANLAADETLERLVLNLEEARHKVVLVQSVPTFEGWRPDTCSLPTLMSGGCVTEQATVAVELQQGGDRRLIADVARRTDVTVLDPLPFMCGKDSCSTSDDGMIRYRDSDHITVAQSVALADAFQPAITAASNSSQ